MPLNKCAKFGNRVQAFRYFFFHSNNRSQHVEHFAAVIKGLMKISSVLRKEAGSVLMMAMASQTALGSASSAEQVL